MPCLREILSKEESLEITRLKILMVNTTSLRKAMRYKRQIEKIMLNARNRYLHLV